MIQPNKFWIIIISTLLCLVWCKTLTAQVRSNPFDIQDREKIDLYSSQSKVNPIFPSDSTQNNTVIHTSTQKDFDKSNPFDVDHIPLKKENALYNSNIEIEQVIENTKYSHKFLIWFLIFNAGLLAFGLAIKPRWPSSIVKSLTNYNFFLLLYREKTNKISLYDIIFYSVFCISFGIFVYLSIENVPAIRGLNGLFYIIGGIMSVYFIRYLSMSALGSIFDISDITSKYLFTINTHNMLLGILLLPIVFIMAFATNKIAHIVLIFGIIPIVVLYLIRLIKGLLIISDLLIKRIFQIIIYLCAFELVPYLIVIRIIISSGINII